MAQNNWEADKMLDVYIYDYLLKKNLHTSAKAFMAEGKVASDPVAIDAPGGFLFEWWSVFWDIFIARTNEKHSEAAAAYIEAQHMKAREQQQQQQQQQQMHRQQVQIMQHRQAQMQLRDPNLPSLSGSISNISSESMLGQSNASALAAKMYEERMKHPSSMESEPNSQLIDASRMALLKSSTNQGQLVHGVPGNVSATMQQIQARQQTADIKSDVNMPAAQRSLPIDQSIYGAGILPSKPGLGSPGLSQAANGLPLKGWPLTAFDQLRPGLGPQIQKPLLQSANQFQIFTPQVLAQSQAQGNLGSQNFGDIDPRRFRSLARVGLNGKDAQSTGNDGSVGSPLQSGSPKVRASSQDQAELLMKMKMSQMQQSCAQQQTSEQLQQQQSSRKRKQPSSSGAANSTGTGNTAGGLATSSNQLDNMDHFGDVGSLEENVDSFLSPHNDGDPRDVMFAPLKRGSAEHNMDSSKGFSFNEVGCLRSSNSKVLCCHFSSDGKLLASAGHEKKAVLWNMDTLLTETTPDEHSHLITDIRFRPNSTQLATSSLDRTIRLWNAAEPSYCLHMFAGHNSPVMSLDFHPTKADLLCSCDGSGEIRLWSVNQLQCSRVSKGATTQVRFQPRVGQYLATAAENIVSIFDVELDKQTHKLQGHTKEVQSVCWDTNGDYLASVAEDSVRVWSLSSGWECIHEFRSSENSFHSCVFHPAYPSLLVIGGSKALELWNMADNKTLNVQAHDSVIAALAVSNASGMVASASHDKCVKIWK